MGIIKYFSLIFMITSLFVGCGGGGSSAPASPAPVNLSVETVTISGNAVWPGATLLEVTLDGVNVPVTNGAWSAAIDVTGGISTVVEVSIVADSVVVATREVTVTR